MSNKCHIFLGSEDQVNIFPIEIIKTYQDTPQCGSSFVKCKSCGSLFLYIIVEYNDDITEILLPVEFEEECDKLNSIGHEERDKWMAKNCYMINQKGTWEIVRR